MKFKVHFSWIKYAKVVLVLWLILVLLHATYVFLVPHGAGFAPEVGPVGGFVWFTVIYSEYYFGAALVVGLILRWSDALLAKRSQ